MKSKRNKVIGRTLQSARMSQGLNQRELARALHTTQTVVSRIESGVRDVRLSEVILFAVCLKMRPHNLFLAIKEALEEADIC